MAIIDRREIEFDLNAVQLALECSPNAANAFGLPPRLPDHVRCKPADGVVEVTYGKLTDTRVFTLRAEALGAILLTYCNRVGMPMPREADKAVRIEPQHVIVVLTLHMHQAPRPESPEGPIGRLPDAISAWSWLEADD
jgi:hypothetical protein